MQQLTNTSQRDAIAIGMGRWQSGLASLDVLVFGTMIVLISVCIAFAVRIGTVLAFLTTNCPADLNGWTHIVFALAGLKLLALGGFLAAAVILDVHSRRIPNGLCALMLVSGLVCRPSVGSRASMGAAHRNRRTNDRIRCPAPTLSGRPHGRW